MTLKVFCDICGDLIPEKVKGEGEDVGLLTFTFGLIGADEPHKTIVEFEELCEECVAILSKAVADGVHKCNLEGMKRRAQK